MRILLSLLLLAVSFAPALAQDHGESRRYFKDWLVACRGDGYCSATAYQDPSPGNETVADYILRVGRHAQQTYWEISFTPVATTADEWQEFTFSVDAVPETFASRSEIGAYGAINDFYLLGDGAQALMDRLAPGDRIEVSFTDTTGIRRHAEFSLAGLTAALIWIDEQQRRLGSERVASMPPYGLTPAGAEQTATPPVPVALLERLAEDHECEPLADLPNGRDIYSGTLDESHVVYVLPCWAGAYNFGSKIFIESAGSFEAAYFAEYSGELGWTGSSTLANVEFDPASGQLSSLGKSRGIGDCGSSGLWEWRGRAFALVEFRWKEACDEQFDEWPLIYPPQP